MDHGGWYRNLQRQFYLLVWRDQNTDNSPVHPDIKMTFEKVKRAYFSNSKAKKHPKWWNFTYDEITSWFCFVFTVVDSQEICPCGPEYIFTLRLSIFRIFHVVWSSCVTFQQLKSLLWRFSIYFNFGFPQFEVRAVPTKQSSWLVAF